MGSEIVRFYRQNLVVLLERAVISLLSSPVCFGGFTILDPDSVLLVLGGRLLAHPSGFPSTSQLGVSILYGNLTFNLLERRAIIGRPFSLLHRALSLGCGIFYPCFLALSALCRWDSLTLV